MELFLGFVAAELPKVNVHGLYCFGRDCFVDNAPSYCVVGLDWLLRLRPTHFDQGLTNGDHFFGTGEEVDKFGFDCQRQDIFGDLGYGED